MLEELDLAGSLLQKGHETVSFIDHPEMVIDFCAQLVSGAKQHQKPRSEMVCKAQTQT